jgi:hypothetical protein
MVYLGSLSFAATLIAPALSQPCSPSEPELVNSNINSCALNLTPEAAVY